MLRRLRRALSRRVVRARKYLWQRVRLSRTSDRRVVFVVGCQRSGTNMLMRAIDRSPLTWIYNEGTNAAFADYRLRPTPVIERLVQRSPAPTVVFKPICDAHLTDRLIEQHRDARAVWIYRDYADVCNSMVALWGDHEKEIVRQITERRWGALGWRGERLSASTIQVMDRLYHEGLTSAEGAALVWYMRNRFFFELGLMEDRRVRLARYEDLVASPSRTFSSCFAFLDCPFDAAFVSDVVSSSVRKQARPHLAPAIEALCGELLARLDREYARHERSGGST